MKLVFKILLSIFLLFLLLAGGGLFYLSRGLEAGEQLMINNINFLQLADGEYNGSYDAGRWSNEVRVTVADKKIKDIKLIRDVMFAKPEVTAELFAKVISEQQIRVDVISGSTVTSKAYLKAVEDALSRE